jgi:hypothetical protein
MISNFETACLRQKCDLTLSCPHDTKYFGKQNEIFLPAPYYKIPFIANISGTMLS